MQARCCDAQERLAVQARVRAQWASVQTEACKHAGTDTKHLEPAVSPALARLLIQRACKHAGEVDRLAGKILETGGDEKQPVIAGRVD